MTITTLPLTKQLREMLILLAVIFVLGVSLTTVIGYDTTKPSKLQLVVLGLHALVALRLLMLGGVMAYKQRRTQLNNLHIAGLGSLLLALATGGIASSRDANWAILLMALGFLGAAVAYCNLYLKNRTA